MRIEDVLVELKEKMTIVLVTNLVQQARRLADHVASSTRELVEVGTQRGDVLGAAARDS